MRKTKVFRSGNSQAVRLPKEFQIAETEVEIYRREEEIILRKKPKNLVRAFELLVSMPEDFFAEGRTDIPPQPREEL
jgi:antitoxin VapB